MFRRLAKKFMLAIPDVRRVIDERDAAIMRASDLEAQANLQTQIAADQAAQLHAVRQELETAKAAHAPLKAGEMLPCPVDPALAWERLELPDGFRDAFRTVMTDTFYRDNALIDITNSEVFERDLAAHTEYRFRVFEQWIATWLRPVAPDMSQMTAIEVGSGTGSSTLAFAREVKRLISFEIDTKATAAAKARLSAFGLDNVEFHDGQFDAASQVARSGEQADLIILCAVLEHMTHQERMNTLKTAWATLRSGGLLVVADTPNRFAVFDDHTSLLPYYSALPTWLQEEYSRYSPRADFKNSIDNTPPADMPEVLARWGAGISYHDFELALGQSIHEYVVLDGYESSLLAMYPDRVDDGLMRIAFDHFEIPAHRAFTRSLLHFALKKP
jgi:ubiquinone/menaquinone biosynthesis C-methylase UbiE